MASGIHRGSPTPRRGHPYDGRKAHARPSSTVATRPPLGHHRGHHRATCRRLGHDRRRVHRAAGGHDGRRVHRAAGGHGGGHAGRHRRHAHRQRGRRPPCRSRRWSHRRHGRRPDGGRRRRDRLRSGRAGHRPGAVRHRPRRGLHRQALPGLLPRRQGHRRPRHDRAAGGLVLRRHRPRGQPRPRGDRRRHQGDTVDGRPRERRRDDPADRRRDPGRRLPVRRRRGRWRVDGDVHQHQRQPVSLVLLADFGTTDPAALEAAVPGCSPPTTAPHHPRVSIRRR